MSEATGIFGTLRLMSYGLVSLATAALSGCGGDDAARNFDPAEPGAATPPPKLQVAGESRVLSATDPVPLLRPASSIDAVWSHDGDGARVEYQEGRDYALVDGQIARTNGSRIPDFATYTYVAGEDGKFTFSSEPRNPPLTITYVTYVSYRAEIEEPLIVPQALPYPVSNVVCLGDSIAAGAHTIASFYRATDADSWCGLLRRHLGGSAVVSNPSIVGGMLDPIVADVDAFVRPENDTVILALGMNDQLRGSGSLLAFRDGLDRTVSRLQQMEKNVVLVGFFQQNTLWDQEIPADTLAYDGAIETVASARGVPFIDIHEAFERAAPEGTPTFLHLTADFLHHPNNYGQRIYFSMLVPYFLTTPTAASTIEGYVIGPWSNDGGS